MKTKEYTARKIKSAFNKIEKNGKVTRTLKGGELYTGIEAIKYNILHLLSPVDMEIEDTFMMEGRRYKKLI